MYNLKDRRRKKFVLIAKVTADHFVKYRFNDINNVIEWMLKNYPDLRFINFYYNTGVNKRLKFAEYGSKKGLIYL